MASNERVEELNTTRPTDQHSDDSFARLVLRSLRSTPQLRVLSSLLACLGAPCLTTARVTDEPRPRRLNIGWITPEPSKHSTAVTQSDFIA